MSTRSVRHFYELLRVGTSSTRVLTSHSEFTTIYPDICTRIVRQRTSFTRVSTTRQDFSVRLFMMFGTKDDPPLTHESLYHLFSREKDVTSTPWGGGGVL